MEILIMGVKKVDFKGKDGKQLQGFNVYFAYKDEHIDGSGCDRIFLSPARFAEFAVVPGHHYDAYYNRYGKIDSMQEIG